MGATHVIVIRYHVSVLRVGVSEIEMKLLVVVVIVVVAVFCVSVSYLPTVQGDSDVCYSYLGCFSMSSPWFTLWRLLPPPMAPDVIDTNFYLYTRATPKRYYVSKLPNVSISLPEFSGVKPTFFIAHGFLQNGNDTWLSDMKDALLEKYDCNVILVDWGRCSSNINYFLVASSIRVVAAEVVRLSKYLIESKGAVVSNWHLIGHSLGAHVVSYVGKAIPGIGRITALDPAQPAFEGYSKRVRLDASDAEFVEVIHTNARPFIPEGGLGMVAAIGHVDFYMNGGRDQPGCDVPLKKVKEFMTIMACPHQRAYMYFTASIRDNSCTFWGRRQQDIKTNVSCGANTCSPMGLDTVNYPARGSFYVTTNSKDPFCFPDQLTDKIMDKFRTKNYSVSFSLKPLEYYLHYFVSKK